MRDLAIQVQALRKKAGILTSLPRALLSVTGPDRVKFLHNLLTHDIKGLAPGQGRPACLLDRQGKMLCAFFVYAHPETLWLETDPPHAKIALQDLRRYVISEKVETEDVSLQFKAIALYGPSTQELLQGVSDLEIPLAIRWDFLGVARCHLWAAPQDERKILEKILSMGKSLGLEEVSEEALEILRIEKGIPRPGAEMSEEVILNELWNYEEWVSFTKGCFVGQEIVARIKYRAHPPRQMTGFLLEGNCVPAPKSSILLGEKEVGILTSACFSPTLDRPIALGFLTYGLPDKQFMVKTPEGLLPATATPLPFI